MPRAISTIPLATLLSLLAGLLWLETGTEAAEAAPSLATSHRSEAPDFALPAMDGEVFRLSEHRGKVVVLNFWATWCGPCLKEMPSFIALQREYRDEGLLFVGVSLDQGGWEAVRPFAERLGVNYPIVIDDGSVEKLYEGITMMPSTFFIDRSGRIEIFAPGMIEEGDLREVVEDMLAAP